MKPNFLLEYPEDEQIARRDYPVSYHFVEFRCRGKHISFKGGVAFDPDRAVVYVYYQPPKSRFANRLWGLGARVKTTYSDLVARVVSESPRELLERPGGLVSTVRHCFPKAPLTEANERCLRELAKPLLQEISDYSAFCDSMPSLQVEEEKARKIVDFILNVQGKFFDLSFYERINHGIDFSEMVFCHGQPWGVLKGLLLRRGYIPHTRKQGPETQWYLDGSKEIPDDLRAIKPFK